MQMIPMPDGSAIPVIILSSQEFAGYCLVLAKTAGIDPKALLSAGFIPIHRGSGLPKGLDPFQNVAIPGDKLIICLDTHLRSLVEMIDLYDLATSIGGEVAEKTGQLPVLELNGMIIDDFKPDIRNKGNCYITRVNIFRIRNVGYFGQVFISTIEKDGAGMLRSKDWMFKVKIDLENRQFLILEKEKQDNRPDQYRIQDRLKNIKNLDAIIEKVCFKIIEEPEAILGPAPDQEDGSDESWRGGEKYDPDFWKKGKKPDDE